MSPLWMATPVVLLAGMACWLVVARDLERSAHRIRARLEELAVLRAEVAALRADRTRAREARGSLHDR